MACTVWSYMSTISKHDDHRLRRRTIFFYAGSTEYGAARLGPSDCFWVVPGTWNEQ